MKRSKGENNKRPRESSKDSSVRLSLPLNLEVASWSTDFPRAGSSEKEGKLCNVLSSLSFAHLLVAAVALLLTGFQRPK